MTGMSDREFRTRAQVILHFLALERRGWKHLLFGRRWFIHHEPLRNDAARLLRQAGYEAPRPRGTRYVGHHVDAVAAKARGETP